MIVENARAAIAAIETLAAAGVVADFCSASLVKARVYLEKAPPRELLAAEPEVTPDAYGSIRDGSISCECTAPIAGHAGVIACWNERRQVTMTLAVAA